MVLSGFSVADSNQGDPALPLSRKKFLEIIRLHNFLPEQREKLIPLN